MSDPSSASQGTYSDYDLVVIGSGPGGYVAAIRASQLGLRTLVVEKDPKLGGTCLHRGCIPTKAWLHTAALYSEISRAGDFGVRVDAAPRFDGRQAKSYRDRVVDKNARGIEHLFAKNKIDTLQGVGRLDGPHHVVVDMAEQQSRRVGARHVLLATGSVPRELPLAPCDGERVLNSDQILQLESAPGSLLVLGAGAVGVEFASIFASLGARVTLIEMLPHILPFEDQDLSTELARCLRRRGIEVLVDNRLERVSRREESVIVDLRQASGSARREAELMLVAVGRTPVVDGIGLETANITTDGRFIPVDELQRTEVPSVYAIGDLVDTPMLAHVASAEGLVAAEHMAGRSVTPLDRDRMPSATYCDPEVASVGLSEAEARERGYDVAVGRFPFAASGKAAILGRQEGFVKVVRETKYDELLGVHIIGPHATDLIAEACVALQLESTTEELFRAIHAHPTLSEALAEAAHAAEGAAIHI